MPNIKSAIKRVKVTKTKHMKNRMKKSSSERPFVIAGFGRNR